MDIFVLVPMYLLSSSMVGSGLGAQPELAMPLSVKVALSLNGQLGGTLCLMQGFESSDEGSLLEWVSGNIAVAIQDLSGSTHSKPYT